MVIALAQINPIIGSLEHNCKKILEMIVQAKKGGARLVVFPEMAICGYPPEDLLLLPSFIQSIMHFLKIIVDATQGVSVIIGCVRENLRGEKKLFNAAAVISEGKLLGFHDKVLLPDYDVFSERRYFEPGGQIVVWEIADRKIGITICEDIWQHAEAVEYSSYLRDPIKELKVHKPDLLINLSASPYYTQQHEIRMQVCRAAARSLNCPILLCNQVGGNDSLIFDGYSLWMGSDGTLINYAKGFEEDLFFIDFQKPIHKNTLFFDPIADLFNALVLGVRDYFHKLGWQKGCLGVSGGIDSALVAVIASKALGKENVVAFALPSRYSSAESFSDAEKLAQNLGLNLELLSIEKPFEAFLEALSPYFQGRDEDVTEENLQARIRGVLLMAFSNKFGYLLLSAGNKSEMAMGYTTLYGDMCGGLAVLSDVTKMQVYALADYINREKEVIPNSIMTKAPSAELRYNQKDTDSLPEYAIIDCIVQAYVEEHLSTEEIAKKYHFGLDFVKELVCKIHLNEYKRRQAPPGLRVTKKAFTAGRRFPIVQHWNVL